MYVSPGFMPRPSLSEHLQHLTAPTAPVSPGFMPRPSLSVDKTGETVLTEVDVSPGFMPRPSLSEAYILYRPVHRPVRVAGVYAPAFVERVGENQRWEKVPMCRRGLCPGLR